MIFTAVCIYADLFNYVLKVVLETLVPLTLRTLALREGHLIAPVSVREHPLGGQGDQLI